MYSLTRSDVNSGNPLDLEQIQNETNTKSENLIVLPFLANDSDQTLVFSLLGVTRNITIIGKVAGAMNAKIRNFIIMMDKFVNGKQTQFENTTYHSDLRGISYKVKVNDWEWSFEIGQDTSDNTKAVINYTIRLIESV